MIDEGKVVDLMKIISEIGLLEPVDLIEFEGKLYGFNGCHRYTAHKRLGWTTIQANIRHVDRATFRLHLM
ncbi:sulfiredoxin [Synechococcus sp. SYN20]|nr:sulfiredoxin [Synechococcus sp. SYN20]